MCNWQLESLKVERRISNLIPSVFIDNFRNRINHNKRDQLSLSHTSFTTLNLRVPNLSQPARYQLGLVDVVYEFLINNESYRYHRVSTFFFKSWHVSPLMIRCLARRGDKRCEVDPSIDTFRCYLFFLFSLSALVCSSFLFASRHCSAWIPVDVGALPNCRLTWTLKTISLLSTSWKLWRPWRTKPAACRFSRLSPSKESTVSWGKRGDKRGKEKFPLFYLCLLWAGQQDKWCDDRPSRYLFQKL